MNIDRELQKFLPTERRRKAKQLKDIAESEYARDEVNESRWLKNISRRAQMVPGKFEVLDSIRHLETEDAIRALETFDRVHGLAHRWNRDLDDPVLARVGK